MNPTLHSLFKEYLDSLNNNTEVRAETSKAAVHHLISDVEGLKSQLEFVAGKSSIERNFDRKYAQAFEQLKRRGMSQVLFSKIQGSLKQKFVDHFLGLNTSSIEVGHVESNLAYASTQKFNDIVRQKVSGSFSQDITIEDAEELSKILALVESYQQALKALDNITTKSDLGAFLKNSPHFKTLLKNAQVRVSGATLADVQLAIQGQYSKISKEILDFNISNVDLHTKASITRSIKSDSNNDINVSFEIAAFNQFKGKFSSQIKKEFIKYMNSLLEHPNSSTSKELNKTLSKVSKDFLTGSTATKIFPSMTASKSINQLVIEGVSSTISGKSKKPYQATSKVKGDTSINIPSTGVKKSSSIGIIIPKIKVPQLRTKKGQFTSLTSLQTILNKHLHEQIRQNMGSPALNYRTGRFAKSATVERISQSREGMLTAFYTYMKYPYQTFEPGFKQGSEKRNPKTLISKSIREIAATMVGNRMRAVRV